MRERGVEDFVKRWIGVLLAAMLGIGVGLLVAENYAVMTVYDDTMASAYRKCNHILIDRMVFAEAFGQGKTFDRGDVVLFPNEMYMETGEGQWMMKRIVGMPGEWVSIEDGVVCIDGVMLDESAYRNERSAGAVAGGDNMIKRFVDGGQYFVLGDNRGESTDSRHETVGMVRETDILGKVILQW